MDSKETHTTVHFNIRLADWLALFFFFYCYAVKKQRNFSLFTCIKFDLFEKNPFHTFLRLLKRISSKNAQRFVAAICVHTLNSMYVYAQYSHSVHCFVDSLNAYDFRNLCRYFAHKNCYLYRRFFLSLLFELEFHIAQKTVMSS